MIFEIENITITCEENDLKADKCWAIKLGRMLESVDLKNVGLNYRQGDKRDPMMCNCRTCDFSTKSLTCNSNKVKATYFCDGYSNKYWGIKDNGRLKR